MDQRNDVWLENEMNMLWNKHFSDVKRINSVNIRFGRKCRTRFGSIRLSRDKKESRILINGLFKDFFIPKKLIKATIAHEIVHYAHGFSSPLPKLHKYPHQGSCVSKELQSRGLGFLHEFENQWTKKHWFRFVKYRVPRRKRRMSLIRRFF